MASSRPINSLPIENNPQLSGYTIYEDGVKTSIISFETLKSIVSGDTTYVEGVLSGETQNRISGDTYLYELITGETQNRIDSDNTKFNNSGGTINGDVTINEGIIYGNGQGLSGLTIGNAEDETYDNGIFTDFNPQTKIGVAVDRFNEMFKLLAPVPPSPWNMATSFNNTSTSYLAKQLGTNDIVSITTNVSPIFQVGIPENGLGEYDNGILSAYINNNLVDSIDLSVNDSKTTGIIRYQTGDPYLNQNGKMGFWNAIITSSLMLSGLTPSVDKYDINFQHSINGNLSASTYIDNPITPTITNINCNIPVMNSYVSGIKTLNTGQSITNISFQLNNCVSHFYYYGNVWNINQNLIYQQSGGFNVIPTTINETMLINSISSGIKGNVYSENFHFTVRAINSIGQFSSDYTYNNPNYRIDTVSNETERLTSGNGDYPNDFGHTFQSNLSLIDIYYNELQLINGYYKWPFGNFLNYNSLNYSNITTGDNIGGTQYRWATFKLGSKTTPVNNVTITIPSATIGTTWNSIKMFVKIGSSGWLDATTAQSVSAPYSDGDGALDVANSTAYHIRKVTFGTIPRSGDVYVRIGIKSTDTSFTFKKPIII